ncbi:hypothetical protein [Streptomyces sp. NPDC002172]
MSSTPRSIDEVLSRARVFQGEYTDADLVAARHSIARELHELRWVHSPTGGLAAARPAALHERAANDLRALCRGIVRHGDGARRIREFDADRDPDGALAFACLLYLADQEEGAQFWWQYTAGAGNVTGALCLYLLHMTHGELRDAQHWAGQIENLNDLDWSGYTPVAHRAETGPAQPPLQAAVRYTLPPAGQAVTEAAVRCAVACLDVPDGGLGPVPQPTPALAERWQSLVTA